MDRYKIIAIIGIIIISQVLIVNDIIKLGQKITKR